MMYDGTKLQCYILAHRMRGYCEALDEYKEEGLILMMMKAADLLERTWDEYQATLPPDKQIKKYEI